MNFCLGHESARTVDLRGQRGVHEEKFNVSDVYLSSIPPNQMMIPLTSFSCGNKIAFFNDCSWVWSNLQLKMIQIWGSRVCAFGCIEKAISLDPGLMHLKTLGKTYKKI